MQAGGGAHRCQRLRGQSSYLLANYNCAPMSTTHARHSQRVRQVSLWRHAHAEQLQFTRQNYNMARDKELTFQLVAGPRTPNEFRVIC